MAKIDKVLLLVNLLCNRRLVTIKTIQDVCGISYRTSLRYIQTISRANIPVYYDHRLKGYRLIETNSKWVDNASLTDVILLIYSLSFLRSDLNSHYQSEVDSLIKKIISKQSFRLEEILSSFEFLGRNDNNSIDASQELNSILIRLALVLGKDLKLKLSGNGDDTHELIINDPRLWFKDQWKITGNKINQEGQTLLNEILHAKVI